MRRALCILAALLEMTGCAAHAPNAAGACTLTRLAEAPLETRGNLLFVHATIDHAPLTLLIDTGAQRTLLTETTVTWLRLPRDFNHATRTLGIGSPTASWDAKLPDGIVLGGARFRIERVSVGRFAMGRVAGNTADGLIGADILSAFDLDLPAGRITFYQTRPACPDAAPPWNAPYVALSGITTRADRLMVPFELDGVLGMGVIDTGAQLSSVSRRMLERMGVAADALSVDRTVLARGAAPEQVAVRLHRFRELRVGPTVIEAPVLPVVPMTSSMGDALVGADFLRGRRVWLSFAAHRVFITRRGRGPLIATAQSIE